MARWGRADFKELKRLEKRLEQLEQADWDAVCQKTAKKIAAMLLSKVKKRTPVGVVPDDEPRFVHTINGSAKTDR